MTQKDWLYEISFMRPILLILLVSYHAFAPFCGAWEMPAGCEDNVVYKWIALFSRAFRLEAFIFVSGYIFAMQVIMKNKFESIKKLVKSKFLRLVIPCWLFGIIYWLIFKSSPFIRVFTGIGHLWYLLCLFWCFVFGYLLYKSNLSHARVVLLLFVASSFSFIPLPFQLNKAMYYLLFFYLGGVFWNYKNEIFHHVSLRNILAISLLFFVLLYAVNVLINFNNQMFSECTFIMKTMILFFNNVAKALLAYVGILSLYMFASFYVKNNALNEIIIRIGALGYGVYVFHQFILRWLYYKTSFPLMVNQIILPWIGLFVAVILSIVLTILIRKTKLGSKLI